MDNAVSVFCIGGIGFIMGLVFILFVNMTDGARFVKKDKVDAKQTIVYKGYYIQYSAVRRMKVQSTDTVFGGK